MSHNWNISVEEFRNYRQTRICSNSLSFAKSKLENEMYIKAITIFHLRHQIEEKRYKLPRTDRSQKNVMFKLPVSSLKEKLTRMIVRFETTPQQSVVSNAREKLIVSWQKWSSSARMSQMQSRCSMLGYYDYPQSVPWDHLVRVFLLSHYLNKFL